MMNTSDEITQVLRLEAEAIQACAERFQSEASKRTLEKIIETMDQCLNNDGKIVVTGVGKSGKIAQKISATFVSTGSYAIFLHPTEGLHGDLGLLKKNDCVLALSFSGNTEEVLRLIPTLGNIGVPLIGIGGKNQSQLAEACHLWIDAHVEKEACPHNLAPTTSTTLALAIGDALAITLMKKRGFDAEHFALNHPGGSIGKRLTLRVKDLMHQKHLPLAGLNTPMDELVSIASESRLGGVMICEGKRLLGLITDGDIRKSLKQREKFFSLTAKDVMTTHPSTIPEIAKAEEALKLMEDRKCQISVLPVLNENNEISGFLRIHDILREI